MPRLRPCLLLLGCAACGVRGRLDPAASNVQVAPTALDFGGVYLFAAPRQSVALANTGAAPDSVAVTLEPPGGAFAVASSTVSMAPGGALQLPVTFSPSAAGPAAAVLQLRWSAGQATVTLSGTGLAWPSCPPPGPCATSAFDPDAGACTQSPVADGTSCESGDPCLIHTACAAGQCLGQLDLCDDGNACTFDYCVPGEGCQHQDQSAKCQTTNPCEIGRCDPASGCQSSPAPNGTPCSGGESCQTATVCLLGQCTGVPVPNGTPCALWWAPCVGDAACRKGSCDSPTADGESPGQPLWSASGHWSGLRVPPVDREGTAYVLGYSDGGQSLQLDALDACGRTRWSAPLPPGPETADRGALLTPASTVLTPAGVLATDDQGDLAAYDPATGQQLWETFLPAALGGDAGFWSWYSGSVLAASNQGQLALSLGRTDAFLATGPETGPVAAGFTSVPLPHPLPDFWGEVFFDAQGNSYANLNYNDTNAPRPTDGGFSLTSSFDPAGNPRFSFWGPGGDTTQYFEILAVGSDRFVGSGGMEGTGPFTVEGLSLSGAELYRTALPGALATRSAAIDAAGTAYIGASCGPADCDGGGYLAALAQDGSLRWQAILPGGEYPVSGAALGDGNLVYLVTGAADMAAIDDGGFDVLDNSIVALDTTSGALVWRAPLGPAQWTDYASLAVTPAGTLLVNWWTNGTLTAYFLGPHKPSPDAPWPREGGDNRNGNSPQPVGAAGP
ncbi:MAG: outer membrane protein assembly factor BamB family protein [Myxococcales bacterium]